MFRLLGLLGGLAAVTDLGTGAATDESLARAVVACRLARVLGCEAEAVHDVVYVSLLEHVGCTAYSVELAAALGDDVVATRMSLRADLTRTREALGTLVPALAGATGRSRAAVAVALLRHSSAIDREGPAATCEVAREASRRLGLTEPVQDALGHTTASWDGRGVPAVAGGAIPLATRLTHVASIATTFTLLESRDRARAEVRRRAGTALDPELSAALADRADEVLDGIGEVDAYELLLDAEPDPVRLVDGARVEQVARVFGDMVDLKSPWLHGHSSAVAELTALAGRRVGLAEDTVGRLRCAGHLHDIGRAGVSSRVWNKAGPLSATERDQARLHPYHGERIVARVPALAGVAPLVGRHHERLDGSGYPHGALAADLSMEARVLAAADAYQTWLEGRPHDPPRPATESADRVLAEVRAGRLDGDAVEAVLGAAGHRGNGRRVRPAGLTSRQVEVLRLVAAGLSNKEVAARLVISPRTAEHHIQDVYSRIGVATRAGAALFAMEHGLFGGPPADDGAGADDGPPAAQDW
ncbi:HD domain-containing protein [Antribacter sp. KLBMP9083]|uniref:HD domain-containing protein n=1 Tax=Antribacter soli TaxID=2910976 RepID=A0AA41UBV5_9MICO|nr:HD domain-containing phosphohydrolase [Antribacter soli]MCF4121484.1 HD domain-containing protein [Antribacter soli]